MQLSLSGAKGMAWSRQQKFVPPCPANAGQSWSLIQRVLSCHALPPCAPLPCPSASSQTRPAIVLRCSHLIVRLEHEHGDAHYKGAQVQHDLVHERVGVLLTESVEEVAAQEVEHDAVGEGGGRGQGAELGRLQAGTGVQAAYKCEKLGRLQVRCGQWCRLQLSPAALARFACVPTAGGLTQQQLLPWRLRLQGVYLVRCYRTEPRMLSAVVNCA